MVGRLIAHIYAVLSTGEQLWLGRPAPGAARMSASRDRGCPRVDVGKLSCRHLGARRGLACIVLVAADATRRVAASRGNEH
jgi:hypothetical protein